MAIVEENDLVQCKLNMYSKIIALGDFTTIWGFHVPMFYAVFVTVWHLYHSDGDVYIVLLRQWLIRAVSSV